MSLPSKETVLVVGATGNIGVSAVKAVLQTGRHVLAVVRNEASATKLFYHVGTTEGITTVLADLSSESGVKNIVEQVKAGKLPAFQHVYAAAGGGYSATPLQDIGTEELRQIMTVNFESNFWTYRATIPYLLHQNDPRSTWTLCTGSQGDLGARAPPALTQGALFSLANVACRDNYKTNVRFNEVYLALRVEVDESAAKTGAMKATDFAKCYAALLSSPEIRSSRVSVLSYDDLEILKYQTKVKL